MSGFSNECPKTSELVAVLEGQAPEDLLNAVMDHLDHCDLCVKAIDDLSGPNVADSLNPRSVTGSSSSDVSEKAVSITEEIEKAEQRFVNRLKSSFRFMTPTSIGKYKVLRKVGQGMMGEVFECEDPKTANSIAVKTIRNHVISPVMVTRISQEARLLAGLDHPNIVKFIEFGMTQDGMPFLVIEFVNGGTLSERIRKGPLAPNQAAKLIRDCAEALDHAHSRGVLHRDLKPSNILLANSSSDDPALPGGTGLMPKIADFGLARYFEGETHVTQSGSLVGTPGYMSPEQIHSGNRIGPESDIFSLGTILYEAMTAASPFQATSLAGVLHQIQQADPESPRNLVPEIPRNLELICLKCLEKRPEDRYLKASDLAADLSRFLKGEPIHAKPLPPRVRFARWYRANRMLAASLLLSALLMVLLAVGGVVFGFSQSRLLELAIWARNDADQQRLIAIRERDMAVKFMDDATGALYGSFLMTRDGELLGNPDAQRLRERIAGQFFDIAKEARKIEHLERDKSEYLCGLIHKSAIIQWEMGAKHLALEQIHQFFEIYSRIQEPKKNLDGLTAQVIDLRVMLGMAEFDRFGPDHGIPHWIRTWDEWYGKGDQWRRESIHSLRAVVNFGRLLVETLERNERWDDLKRIEPQLIDAEMTFDEISKPKPKT